MTSIVSLLLLLNWSLFIIGEPITEDLTIKFVEPIDDATKLLYDLDHKIQLYIKDQELIKNDTKTIVHYSVDLSVENTKNELMSKNADSKEPVEESNIASLLSNLNELDKKLQSTFQDLQSRRRYVLGAMIRQMQSTVRRIRSNMSRMQMQLNTIETVATQVPLLRPNSNANGTSNQPNISHITANKEIIEQLEERINIVSMKINEIVIKLNSSLNTSPTNTNNIPISSNSKDKLNQN